MLVNFCKMQALGNDFVVIDLITQNVKLHTAHIKQIADRHLGIGCDQVLLIEPPLHEDRDFFYRIYNADGFEAEQCGNGARCVARFFYDSGFTNRSILKADCLAGPVEFEIEADQNITVNMGTPNFDPIHIPFLPEKPNPMSNQKYTLSLEGETVEFFPLSIGNPHAVILAPNLVKAPVSTIGKQLSNNYQFPNGTNVEFMQIVSRDHVVLRVFERGVGETLACGSGACAAIVAGIHLDLLDHRVKVHFQSDLGHLTVQWSGESSPILMTGPALSVFVGRFRL